MGNEKQIKKSIEESKSHFLPQRIPGPGHGAEVYALDKEFSKTKKNRSIKYILVFSLFLCLLIGGAAALIYFNTIKQQNKENLFADTDELALKNLLQDSSNDQKNLRQLEKQVAASRQKLKERQQLLANDPVKWEEAKRSLNLEISQLEEKILILQQKILNTQTKIRTGLSEAQATLNNTEVMLQMKLDKQRKEYEDKLTEMFNLYNPVFAEKNVLPLLKARVLSGAERKNNITGGFADILAAENIYQRSDFENFMQDVISFDTLANRVAQVPYKNSVSQALPLLHVKKIAIANEFDKLHKRSAARIAEKNALINSFIYALQQQSRNQNETGYIVDARNPQRILLLISDRLPALKNQKAFVFRRDDELIGEISISRVGSHYYGAVIRLSSQKVLQPFDKIVLNLK